MDALRISLPVRQVRAGENAATAAGQPGQVTAHPADTWHRRIPAIAQVLRDGWDLDPVTVLVGENGSGKSTLVEAVAQAYGMGPEGGAVGSSYRTRVSESPLAGEIRLVRGIGAPKRGYFLRAETMHNFYSFLEANPGQRPEPRFHEMSHGESFLELIADRMTRPGLYILDEPESALSFSSCLALVSALSALVAEGSQVLLSTHSPLLAAMPGAGVWQLSEAGMQRTEWADTDLVRNWRGFLGNPAGFLRHLA